MKIILISGKAGSGKTEVAKIMQRKLIYDKCLITNLSKYIKLFVMELTTWDGNDLTKPRLELQTTGDDLRNIRNDFLTNRMKEDIGYYRFLGYKYVIISDVRLLSEIDYFDDLEDEVIKIRVNSKYNRRNLNELEKSHDTEIELDDYDKFDYIIENNDENLEEKVDEILKGMI